MTDYFKNKAVLITGGTGSFGKKLICKLLKDTSVARVVVFSRDELKQEEMRTMYGFTDNRLRYFIGDVRDVSRLKRAMAGIDIVVHAAALKQVLACEYNPIEAIRTNINGAENVINAAIDMGVKKVIALSTDKAVYPANLYGATKLVSEKLFIQGNSYSSVDGTKLSCVRYGNVIGSRGSVIPLFVHQKKEGILTVTDERMSRFWLTLDQAADFVMESISEMCGGEIFIPKIPSMNILDLAKAVAPEAKIKITGIRPGEKLYETLISEDESRDTYEFKRKYLIRPINLFREPKNNIWAKGKKMVAGSSYNSSNNKEFIGLSKLKTMIREFID